MPKWNGELYAGDSKRSGITRAQSGITILATDPKFDEYLAMSYADFRSFMAVFVYGCKDWKAGTTYMSSQEALDVFKVVIDDLQAGRR